MSSPYQEVVKKSWSSIGGDTPPDIKKMIHVLNGVSV